MKWLLYEFFATDSFLVLVVTPPTERGKAQVCSVLGHVFSCCIYFLFHILLQLGRILIFNKYSSTPFYGFSSKRSLSAKQFLEMGLIVLSDEFSLKFRKCQNKDLKMERAPRSIGDRFDNQSAAALCFSEWADP